MSEEVGGPKGKKRAKVSPSSGRNKVSPSGLPGPGKTLGERIPPGKKEKKPQETKAEDNGLAEWEREQAALNKWPSSSLEVRKAIKERKGWKQYPLRTEEGKCPICGGPGEESMPFEASTPAISICLNDEEHEFVTLDDLKEWAEAIEEQSLLKHA